MADFTIRGDTKLDTKGVSTGLSKIGSTVKTGLSAVGITSAAITTALSTATFAAIKFGSEFETSFAKASTLFGDVAVDTENLKTKILELSSATGVSATELNETLYQALSAGVPVTEDITRQQDRSNRVIESPQIRNLAIGSITKMGGYPVSTCKDGSSSLESGGI